MHEDHRVFMVCYFINVIAREEVLGERSLSIAVIYIYIHRDSLRQMNINVPRRILSKQYNIPHVACMRLL